MKMKKQFQELKKKIPRMKKLTSPKMKTRRISIYMKGTEKHRMKPRIKKKLPMKAWVTKRKRRRKLTKTMKKKTSKLQT
jgi:hypothetical protein